MSHDHGADIDKHVKTYLVVFASLLALTVITVAASYLDLSVGPTIALALFIASIKGSLVACYFMHLISERKMIYWVLILAMIFFIFVMFIPIVTESNNIRL